MSYKTQQKLTPIESLPELEDVSDGRQPFEKSIKVDQIRSSRYPSDPKTTILSPEENNRVQKFIRNNHIPLSESGMYENIHQQPSMEDQRILPESSSYNQQYDNRFYQPQFTGEPSCLDCARHALSCPVCKSYFNNDKTLYIIAIIVLSAICLLLLKKVLNL